MFDKKVWEEELSRWQNALFADYYRPKRPRYFEAFAAMTDVSMDWLLGRCARTSPEGMLVELNVVNNSDGSLFWERMCAQEVLPMDWSDDPSRLFLSLYPSDAGSYRLRRLRSEWAPVPSAEDEEKFLHRSYQAVPARALDALSLGSDYENMQTAELLAREFVSRLAPWGVPHLQKLHWQVVRNGGSTEQLWIDSELRLPSTVPLSVRNPPAAGYLRRAGKAVQNALSRAVSLPLLEENPNTRARCSRLLTSMVSETARRAAAWSAFAAGGALIPDSDGQCFADFPNPYEPAATLCTLGYVLEALTPDGIFLLAPSL